MESAAPFNKIFLEPLYSFLDKVNEILPGMLWFVIIVILGYLISTFIGWVVKKVLYKIKLDKNLRKMDLHDSMGDVSIAKLTGILIKWYIFMLFLNQAILFIDLGALSQLFNRLIEWLPDLILSIAIIVAGLIMIDFIIHRLLELKNQYIKFIANILKGILIIIVMLTAIEQLGIKTEFAQNMIIIIIAAILITFSLALGIGLGLSMKDELKPFIKKYSKKLK
jgi:mechanosensitive ion channel-like protein